MTAPEYFLKPTAFERFLNKAVALFARVGIAPAYMHLLRVQGRRTGKSYSTPVNLFYFNGQYYLVCGRGHSGWSKNAEAVGQVTLIRGSRSRHYRVIRIPNDEKPPILKAYLGEYRHTVQKFFTVPAGAPLETFRGIADQHPVFRLTPINSIDTTS